MSTPTLAELIAAAQAIIDPFLMDTCSVKGVTIGSPDGYGGETATHPTVATGVACHYEPMSDQTLTVTGGAVSGTTRHKIFMKLSDADLQDIGPGFQIIVAARGDKPALTFEDPRRLDESTEVLLTVSARLKQ